MELYTWDYGTDVPIKWRIEYAAESEQMRSPALRIWFVLSGSFGIRIGTRFFRLAADEVILVNPYEIYAITEDGGTVAVYDLDLSRMKSSMAEELYFELNPQTAADEEGLRVLKEMFARLVKFNEDGGGNELLNTSFYYAILHHLVTLFRSEMPAAHKKGRHIERAEEIARYIYQSYTRPLSLEDVAEHFYLSVPYLSKAFKRYFGVTFTDYLMDMRLAAAMRMLSKSNQSLELVAEQCGLPNARSLIANFKRKYGYTPGQFRGRSSALKSEAGVVSGRNDLSLRSDLSLFAKYLGSTAPQAVVRTDNRALSQTEVPPCNTASQGTKLVHTWKKLTSIGKARDILSGVNQEILRTVQREIGFEYIIFQGILDDDMMVYAENADGQPDLNFCYVDEIIDFLLDIELKPFIQLSFMPSALARPGGHTVYYRHSVISMPRDMKKWRHLIRELVLHLNARYGAHMVASFPFTVWNCPDSGTELFGLGGVEAYFELYRTAFEAAREANADIQFSGPSLLTVSAEDGVFLSEYLRMCFEHHCVPDSIQYHFYPVSLEKSTATPLQSNSFMKYRSSPDALRESIATVRGKLADLPGNFTKLAITEWNASISHRALLSDTAYQAAYIIKNVLENYDSVDALCYWFLSDDIAEIRMAKEIYHGGMGLFTYNGMKKASYEAVRLLTKLGSRKLASGEGWFITRSEIGLQVVLYNYQHFSELYSKGELFDMTFTNRYTPFPNETGRRFTVMLTDLTGGKYLCTETSLSAGHGSSFDIWLKSGAQPLRTREDVEHLKSMSVPRIRKFIAAAENNCLTLTCTLDPHEVRVIELSETQEEGSNH